MPRTPMDTMLDAVDWRQLPKPSDVVGPYAVMEGELVIGEHRCRCYVLNDGRRVLDSDDVAAFFGVQTGDNLLTD